MPSKEFKITILNGLLQGFEIVKYTQMETDTLISAINSMGLSYKVIVSDIDFSK